MRREMLKAIHYSHLGIVSCLRRARDVLFWPGMSAQVKDFISKCSTVMNIRIDNVKNLC